MPEQAHVVLDLCTGDGSSLPGLRRPGRLVIGLDASLAMLELAAEADWRGGWGPRLVCGDAFHLPFAAGSLDAVTIAFGIRNLRPQDAALAELARVLRPGGTLAVLEATGPRRGALAPFHRFYLRRIVPVLGRLSRDPSAYRYLAESILEFGPGGSFTSAAEQHGFHWRGARRFMLGATRLWVASAPPAAKCPLWPDVRPWSSGPPARSRACSRSRSRSRWVPRWQGCSTPISTSPWIARAGPCCWRSWWEGWSCSEPAA